MPDIAPLRQSASPAGGKHTPRMPRRALLAGAASTILLDSLPGAAAAAAAAGPQTIRVANAAGG